MRVLNVISFLFVAILIAKSYGGIEIFLNMQCVELYAEPTGPTFDKPKAAMKSCIEGSTCIGVKKTSKNEYQELRRLTGYVFNGTCKDYYLWDKSRGVTFRHQPHELEAAILYAIYPNRECPTSFDVAGSLCRGLSSITEDICGTYPSYMAPRYDGTSCYVVQKQTVINKWS